MSTDTMQQEQLEADAERDAAEQVEADAIRAEVEAVDVGDVGDTEEERMVQRYLKLRFLADAEKTRLKDQMTAMIAQLDAKIKRLDWFGLPIAERLAKARVTEKKRSVKLHYGTIGFRMGQPKVTVTNEALLIVTARNTTGMEKCWRQLPPPPPEIVKGELNAYVKATGDVPAGCTVEPAKDEFYAK